ncbi:hydroxyacylglutathione hydrolase [Solilutibacter pythonis]|uniref:hydroxyacylglutathione hydrolase n=1 Tax=Solilutibacter pythonis TaxID=2483112 RepID=UPI001FE510E2|nr:hydroxyacylglutathione hydrolase [Lysobacter pythonis]
MLPPPLPFFEDNYLWWLPGTPGPLLVDPGDAAPALARFGETPALSAILLTHHHSDHIGGVAALLERWPGTPVIAPRDERIVLANRQVGDGERIEVGGHAFTVMAVPGHTRSHLAYHGDGFVFCGDALFSLGCGRMFEGDAPTMLASLDRLAALPDQTAVCCAHEYTLANAAFAEAVMADSPALAERTQEARAQRRAGHPSLPSTIASERACNPFLRVDAPEVRAALARRLGAAPGTRADSFAALRRWKDEFRA